MKSFILPLSASLLLFGAASTLQAQSADNKPCCSSCASHPSDAASKTQCGHDMHHNGSAAANSKPEPEVHHRDIRP